MAKPLDVDLLTIPRDVRSALKQRVQDAPAEHAEAVLAALDLLDELHTSGTLDVLRGAVGASGELLKLSSEMAAKPESIRAMRNLLVLGKLLGSIDPELLRRLVDGLSPSAEQRDRRPPSLFRIFRRLRSEDSRRALAAATNVIESVGRGLGQPKK